MRYSIIILFLFNCFFSQAFAEPESHLTIESYGNSIRYSRSDLLKKFPIESIIINNNRAYPNQKMTLTSIKLCRLLKTYPIKSTDMLEFISTDNFSVYIPANKVMTCNKHSAIGYLAIEPKEKWPILKNGTGTTAGPFELIWIHPEKSYISNEYWAWSVNKIILHQQLNQDILKLKPQTHDKHLLRGFDIYISHCAGCHTINHIGKAGIGPDLNDPKNPLEYYPDPLMLKKFIRDPQSVRIKQPDRMSGSGEDFLNNNDLNDLINYFRYMENHKW